MFFSKFNKAEMPLFVLLGVREVMGRYGSCLYGNFLR